MRVEAVDRALRILEAFASGRNVLSLKDISSHTGLYKSTILRLCGSLEAFGYVRRGPDGLFRLGPKVWELGKQYERSFDMEVYVRPVLRQIVDQTNETASLYVADKNERVCLYRENSRQAARHHVEEGVRLPLDRGAAGKILQAFNGVAFSTKEREQIRRRGYYVSLGERDKYASSVAAPVFGPEGQCSGALAISGLRQRFTPEVQKKLAKIVVRRAKELTRTLGGHVNTSQ